MTTDFEPEDQLHVSFTGKFIVPLIIIIIAIGGAFVFIKTKPKAKRKKSQRSTRYVVTERLKPSDYQVKVSGMGTITPSHNINLQPRVSGQVIEVSPDFEAGGFFKQGETILKIESSDYKAVLAQKKAELAKAELNYKLEVGRQDIAKREYEMLGTKNASKLEKELTLRKPHLAQMKTALSAAKATLKKAELDLERTDVKAPFNCIVREKKTDIGAQVTSQTVLAELISGDSVYAVVSIPVDKLRWIDIPDMKSKQGSTAKISISGLTNGQNFWTGKIIRQKPSLEEKGRMAQLIIDIPLKQKNDNKLLLGSYVNVLLEGTSLKNIFILPRKAVRDGNQIWIFNEVTEEEDVVSETKTEDKAESATESKTEKNNEIKKEDKKKSSRKPAERIIGKLSIKNIVPSWKDKNFIIITEGLSADDTLITSDISTPVTDMPLWTDKSAEKKDD
ncbi:MAG: efflux RND transporter periplasmic adaptor subunit [Planctomycetota bacterium]|jgi:RND family efflux transporter MFP subunit